MFTLVLILLSRPQLSVTTSKLERIVLLYV